MRTSFLITILIIIGALGAAWFFQADQFPLPEGETKKLSGEEKGEQDAVSTTTTRSRQGTKTANIMETSTREVMVTDGVKHSIPLDGILDGGPGKDGIPSIDEPKFISAEEATFLNDSDRGIGLTVDGESKFYPYRILVWHEIANDTIAGMPVLVTYCPLCATGIVFERRVDGETQEFGVSGKLWKSNLLMYNRAEGEENESLWSQILGEAVLGVHTGKKLPVVRSDIARFGEWKAAHPDTKVLSQDTGATRDYTRDPYGDYYTSDSVSFGATFNDDRLHPKAEIRGIAVDGKYKAYHTPALTGTVTDTFAGKEIVITKDDTGTLTFTADGEEIPSIPSFWFSWVAVHPETELYK